MPQPPSYHNHTDAYLGMTFPWVKTITLGSKEAPVKVSFPNVTSYLFVETDGDGDVGTVDVEGIRFFNNSTSRDFRIVYERVDSRNYYARLDEILATRTPVAEARLGDDAAFLKRLFDDAFRNYMVPRGPIKTQVFAPTQTPYIEAGHPNWVPPSSLVFYLPKSDMQRLRLGFTQEGISREAGTEPGDYFEIRKSGRVSQLNIKCTNVWLYADGPDDSKINCRLTVGLSNVVRQNFPDLELMRARGAKGI